MIRIDDNNSYYWRMIDTNPGITTKNPPFLFEHIYRAKPRQQEAESGLKFAKTAWQGVGELL